MKRYFTVLTASMLLLAICSTGSLAQTQWAKYVGNPILDPGAPGSWESVSVYYPYVIFDNNTYHMWYIGYDGNNERGGYATSEDGIHWTKYAGNPVLDLGPSGDWNDTHVEPGPVLVEGDTLKMWYWGYGGSSWLCGFALSTDGINWTKYDDPATSTAPYAYSDPVLQQGAVGSWDDTDTFIESVIFDAGIYQGWFLGYDGGTNRLGYATSDDGIHWIKYNDPGTTDPPYAESDPVLDLGPPGSWDDSDIEQCQVIKSGETYHMWYKASHGNTKQTGYATSTDGIHWTRYAGNPVLEVGPSGTWDMIEGNVTSVIYQDPLYKMWYTGYGGGGLSGLGIGYAEDFSQIAHPDTLSLNLRYAAPGSDTLKVESIIKNPGNNTLQVKAHMVSDDSMVFDSTEMAFEQDELWSGEWPVPDAEKTFRVAIKIKDLDSGNMHDGMIWNVKKFTTIGPIVIDSIKILSSDQEPDPGDNLHFSFSLKNMGSTVTASNITSKLISVDSCASFHSLLKVYESEQSYGSIDPGASVPCSNSQSIKFLPNCSGPVHFLMEIYSNGYHFWDSTFTIDVVSAIEKYENKIPKVFALKQNFPNPFNPITTIDFSLPTTEFTTLKIYNIIGQQVASLVSDKLNAGSYKYDWDAGHLSSGVYYYMIKAGEWQDVKKMVLVK